MFDPAKAKIKLMSIFLAKGAMVGWLGNLSSKIARIRVPWTSPKQTSLGLAIGGLCKTLAQVLSSKDSHAT